MLKGKEVYDTPQFKRPTGDTNVCYRRLDGSSDRTPLPQELPLTSAPLPGLQDVIGCSLLTLA